eukprot:365040-Chlamydomonas_euryale.AAC.12
MSVARYPRKQFVVARPQDKSRWGQLTRHPHFTNADLFIKYEAEYDDVMELASRLSASLRIDTAALGVVRCRATIALVVAACILP